MDSTTSTSIHALPYYDRLTDQLTLKCTFYNAIEYKLRPNSEPVHANQVWNYNCIISPPPPRTLDDINGIGEGHQRLLSKLPQQFLVKVVVFTTSLLVMRVDQKRRTKISISKHSKSCGDTQQKSKANDTAVITSVIWRRRRNPMKMESNREISWRLAKIFNPCGTSGIRTELSRGEKSADHSKCPSLFAVTYEMSPAWCTVAPLPRTTPTGVEGGLTEMRVWFRTDLVVSAQHRRSTFAGWPSKRKGTKGGMDRSSCIP